MRLRARLTGSRFGRGAVLPGGVREEGRLAPDELLAELDAFDRDLARDRRLFLGDGVDDRPADRHRPAATRAGGGVLRGRSGRARLGLSTDARHERPYGEYRRLGLQVVTHRDEDAMSRVLVRFSELTESLRILRQAGSIRARQRRARRPPPRPASGCAFGWAEAAQGELVIWVEVTDGLVSRMRVASPSFRNWALFEHAFPKDVLTDFAFIEHSFGLTAAGADR